jgi:ABC-type multidrug transport system fused ATPase/permease subunit
MPFSLAGWGRVREVLDEPIEPDPSAAITPADDGRGVQLDSIVFTFAGETRPALDRVSLDVAAGRVVAIVGPTGAGKSTLVELVAGLIPPDSGTVRVGAGARTLVFQEAFLFSGTVRHNIALGDAIGDDEIWHALRLAIADEFVADMPQALDTVVGERGISLSGGQRQRVALARALVRRPMLLLLDDTTSALDPATEAAVLTNLREAFGDTTVLMVASRPSTIALADEVVFLAGGQVVDHGRHADLMVRRAGYRALVEAFETDRASEDAAPVGGGAGE